MVRSATGLVLRRHMAGFVSAVDTDAATCTFTYTQTSPPVLALGEDGAALIRISGDLVRLDAANAGAVTTGPTLAAEGIFMRLSAPDGEGPLEAAPGVRRPT